MRPDIAGLITQLEVEMTMKGSRSQICASFQTAAGATSSWGLEIQLDLKGLGMHAADDLTDADDAGTIISRSH
jgi:hypothetical protein